LFFKKSRSSDIKELLKQSKDYLNSEQEAINHIKSLLLVLMNYVNSEIPSLKEATQSLENIFIGIETLREEKISDLREQCIKPLVELLNRFNTMLEENKEAEIAEKAIGKFRKTVDKERMKKVKGRLDKLNRAQDELRTAIRRSKKEKQDAIIVRGVFNKKKKELIHKVIRNLISVENIHHEKVIDFFKSLEKKVNEIKEYEKEF